MQGLIGEAHAFRAQREAVSTEAAQRAALQILCGLSLDDALAASNEKRGTIVHRVERALKAERIKGAQQHWSYDLNRHIALKQALDRLRAYT